MGIVLALFSRGCTFRIEFGQTKLDMYALCWGGGGEQELFNGKMISFHFCKNGVSGVSLKERGRMRNSNYNELKCKVSAIIL